MPNPVKRHSKARRDKRRSHDFLTAPLASVCPQCKAPRCPIAPAPVAARIREETSCRSRNSPDRRAALLSEGRLLGRKTHGMAMRLDGRVALVTGGSRGIGQAAAIKLAQAGAYVLLNFVQNEAAAAETLALIRGAGGQASLLPFDVADTQAAEQAIGGVFRDRGRIDILVNNAGISKDGLILTLKARDWDVMIGTNLKGVFNCCRIASRYMVKARWGRIVNISSVVAASGNAGQSAYGASKAGVEGLTRSLARELASRNICVNAVAPGLIASDMTAGMNGRVEKIQRSIPLKRLGVPEDIAQTVLFLASEGASYITGQVVHVNGGLYM